MRKPTENTRYRFDRVGNVVRDRRRMSESYGSESYKTGDPLFAARRSSPARRRFRLDTPDKIGK